MKDAHQENGPLLVEYIRLQETVARQQAEIQQLQQRQQPEQEASPFVPNFGNLDQLLFLVDKVFAAVLLTDPQGYVTWVNQGFTRLCGYEPHEAFGQPVKLLLGSCHAASETQAYMAECRARNQPYQLDIPNPYQAEGDAWIRVKSQPVFDDKGQLATYVELIEDISEWKKAQLVLAQKEQHYRALVETAPVMLFEWRANFDGNSKAAYTSPKSEELFGFSPDEASQLADFVHPEDRERFHQSVLNSSYLRVPWHFEGRLVVPGQPLRWFRGRSIQAGEDEQGLLYRGLLEDITSSRLDQAEVQEREQRWRMALEGTGNDNWEYNCITRKLILSPHYRTLLGYHGQKLKLHPNADPWFANVRPESHRASQHALLAYLSGELPAFSTIYHLTAPEGEDTWVLAQGMVTQRDALGNALIVTGSLANVTEITRTKNALQELMLRLASTIGNLQDAILLEDENHKVILVNDAFCRLFKLNCTSQHLIGTDCSKLAEHVKGLLSTEGDVIRAIQSRYKHADPVEEEVLTLKDGRTLLCNATHVTANGRYLGYVWKVEDITQRRNEEEALRRREEKYRSILESLNLGLMEIDLEGKIQFVNQSYCEISGYNEQELLGFDIRQLHSVGSGSQLLEEKPRLSAQGISATYEQSIKTKSRDIKWLLTGGAPLYNDEKQHVGFIGVHLDITHQKQLETKLRAARKKQEESVMSRELFLANMSHEIRTPMNAILGMSQLLAKTPLSEQQNEYLHAISTSADNLLVIINDLLDQAKISAGKLTIAQIGFDLRRVCEQVSRTLQYTAGGLRLNVHVSPDIPEVLLGDPYRLTQVLLTLAGNAIRFTEQGHVWISCELAGTLGHEVVVEFRVRDTGLGLEPEYLQAIYQDFSQESPSTSRKSGSTGLDLTIARNLVNLMGGEILIESEKHSGTVSTFSLLLPIGSSADLPRSEVLVDSEAQDTLRGKRVLLVEDNAYNRVLAKTFLEQAHLVVTEAENGAAAVALAREREFDLILMDVQMPVMNGLEAAACLRNDLSLQIPIIALTASAMRGENQKCLAAGMNDYLMKPFHETALLEIIRHWLLNPGRAEAQAASYRIDGLKTMANNDTKFIGLMLNTFLSTSRNTLTTMQQALLAGDVPTLKAAAHRIKPSITHLQIHQALTPLVQIESWEGEFNLLMLQPLVEKAEKVLEPVMAQIALDIKEYLHD